MATEEQATTRRGVDAKEAVQIARTYAYQFYTQEEMRHLRLEEIEFSIEDGCWNVTLGWMDPAAGQGPMGSLSAMMDPQRQPRVYKVFKIDARTGDVHSMKIRDAN